MDILRREVAKRVFAYELSRSTHETSEGGERAPKYVLTPTGEKCNRIFMVGVLLEKEEVSPDSNFWRIRVSDPTGVVSGFVGRYQPEALEALLEIEPPEIVSIVAKLNMFQGETRRFLSIRPEAINISDRKNRDFWVIETAKRTLERIKKLEEDADDAKLALEIYNPDVGEYLEMVKRAVEAVREEAEAFRKEEGEVIKEDKEKEAEKIESKVEEIEEVGKIKAEPKTDAEELTLESFEVDDLDEFEFEEEEWDLSDILDEE